MNPAWLFLSLIIAVDQISSSYITVPNYIRQLSQITIINKAGSTHMSFTLKPISAILNKDTDTLGKADPYVIFSLGDQKTKSAVCKSGGVKPSWTDSLTLAAKDPFLSLEVWDKDTFSSDDLIGQAKVDLRQAFASPGQVFTQYTNLTLKDKPSGSLQFSYVYNGPAVFAQPPGQPQNIVQPQKPSQPNQPTQQQGANNGFIL